MSKSAGDYKLETQVSPEQRVDTGDCVGPVEERGANKRSEESCSLSMDIEASGYTITKGESDISIDIQESSDGSRHTAILNSEHGALTDPLLIRQTKTDLTFMDNQGNSDDSKDTMKSDSQHGDVTDTLLRPKAKPSQGGASSRCPGRLSKELQRDLLVGLTIGCVLCLLYVVWVLIGSPLMRSKPNVPSIPPSPGVSVPRLDTTSTTLPPGTGIYLGVVAGRAAARESWGLHLSQVDIFVPPKHPVYRTQPGMNIVNITGELPPTASIFDHICRHHLTNYEWFIRAPDDVYIRGDALRDFLSGYDPEQMVYLGHPTLPIDDVSYNILQGDHYCYGGPGVVLSRALMKGLCSVMWDCDWDQRIPPDVALGRCVYDQLDVKCCQHHSHAELRSKFYHSYRENVMDLADEFMTKTDALTLHPVKTPLLLHHLEEHDRLHRAKRLHEEVGRMISEKKELEKKVSGMSLNGTTHPARYVSGVLVEPTGDVSKTSEQDVESYEDGTRECHNPNLKIMVAGKDQVKKLENASVELSDNKYCQDLLFGFRQRPPEEARFDILLLCASYKNSINPQASRLEEHQNFGPPQVKRIQSEPDSSNLVLIVTAERADPHLVRFLLSFQKVLTSEDRVVIYLVTPVGSKAQPDLAWDLRQWLQRYSVIFRWTTITSWAQWARLLMEVRHRHTDTTILVTSPSVRIVDPGFLTRCRVTPKPSRKAYVPCSRTYDTPPSHSSPSNHLPVCLHSSDLAALNPSIHMRMGQILSKTPSHITNLQVTHTLDSGIQYDRK